MIKGLNHFSIIVSSDDSVAFYEKIGFKVCFRKDRESDSVVIMDGYGFQIELFIDSSHPPRAFNPENKGLRGLSFKADNLERIREQFNCGPVMNDWFGKKYCVTNDPDGLPVQFHE